jgi:transcription antitermination factor NusG
MIHLIDTEKVSEHVRNRSKNMWTRTVAPDYYLVKPKEKGKTRRAVRLLTSSSGVYIECTDKVTGEPCPANINGKHCAHVEAAINRLLVNVKRQANKQLKEQSQRDNQA